MAIRIIPGINLGLALVFVFLTLDGCAQKMTTIKTFPAEPADTSAPAEGSNEEIDRLMAESLMFYRQGNLDSAYTGLGLALALDSTRWLAHYYLGLVLSETGNPQAALSSLNSAIRFAPPEKRERSRLYLAMARIWEELEEYGKAEINYGAALNLHPANLAAAEGLGRVKKARF
jgi:tetratricopeptide (TPR) repeat protein